MLSVPQSWQRILKQAKRAWKRLEAVRAPAFVAGDASGEFDVRLRLNIQDEPRGNIKDTQDTQDSHCVPVPPAPAPSLRDGRTA